MENLEEIKNKIRSLMPVLRANFGVAGIGIFGSRVKEKEHLDSDLDILVEFAEPISLFKFIELENFLSGELGIKVDLVMKKSLKPRIGKRILEEVMNI